MQGVQGMKYFSLLTAVTLTACTSQGGVVQYPTHTLINEHLGGRVLEERVRLAQYKKPIEIMGVCASACTGAFKYPDTCVYPNAIIGIHAPSNTDGSINPFVFDVMASDYPPLMRVWFKENCHDTRRDYWFTGYEMHHKFNVPMCE